MKIVNIIFSILLNWVLLSSICGQGELRSTCIDSTNYNIRESIAFYQGRISIDSNDQISYYSIGMSFFKLGDYSTAIQYFDKLEILNPEYPSLYTNRGICKLLNRNKLGACNDFGLSLSRGEDPEIMNGQKVSQWVKQECLGDANSALQILHEGQVCPNFTYRGFDNPPISLVDFAGKYVVIDLWATWCSPCIKERPKYKEIKSKFAANEGIVFISISLDRDVEKWQDYLVTDKFHESQFWAGDGKDEVAYRLALSDGGDGKILMGVPQYVIIDPNGIIANKFHGMIAQLEKEVKLINRRM